MSSDTTQDTPQACAGAINERYTDRGVSTSNHLPNLLNELVGMYNGNPKGYYITDESIAVLKRGLLHDETISPVSKLDGLVAKLNKFETPTNEDVVDLGNVQTAIANWQGFEAALSDENTTDEAKLEVRAAMKKLRKSYDGKDLSDKDLISAVERIDLVEGQFSAIEALAADLNDGKPPRVEDLRVLGSIAQAQVAIANSPEAAASQYRQMLSPILGNAGIELCA
ncbi:MAG: hypothetical protein COV36_04760 [Alphaproteobacteria bacterium CG11_big_fil_rev_8_21_14_0_20_44_7]|nr:MAG: hypothetical protein COV36_04760 [Alphaproteobacteria bacterium CG11_big_fil_rev_8_21_14_0_20_44_7]